MANAKISESHPLKIDPVVIRDGQGVIGLTFCPGKKHQGLYSGAWSRDLRADLEVVQGTRSCAQSTIVTISQDLESVERPLGSPAAGRSPEFETTSCCSRHTARTTCSKGRNPRKNGDP
jgi:ADP-ribosyl-[dinitrogen reductase] hydrolase